MESVKDFFENIMESYKERARNPFTGSYLIAFLFFNWKPISILFFSEWPIHCRIEWIETNYSGYQHILSPLFFALGYVLLFPYLNLVFERFLQFYHIKQTEKKSKQRIFELNRQKQEASLIREIADEKAGTSKINELQDRIESLQYENSALILQNQEDLERHNKTLGQFKIKEDDYAKELTKLREEKNTLKHKLQFSVLDRHGPEVKIKLINVIEDLSEDEKILYTRFFTTERKERKPLSDNFTNKLLHHQLIENTTLENSTTILIRTNLGRYLYDYLLNEGYDLL